MIRRINSEKVLVKVLSWPSLDDVLIAELNEWPLVVWVACYQDGMEAVASLVLSNVRRARGGSDVGYRFMGDHGNFSVVVIDGAPMLYQELGTCLVRVDADGAWAEIGFSLKSSIVVA